MKKFVLIPVVLLVLFSFDACKKDNNKEFNTLKISSGEYSGFTLTFDPNQGFWSPVDETVRYVQLVLGDNTNQGNFAEDVMRILFYYSGALQVSFPSVDGQWIYLGLNIDGTVHYFQEQTAVLTINHLDDYYFEGSLTGLFVDINNNSSTINISMNLSLNMQGI